jgi:hypothetical protein
LVGTEALAFPEALQHLNDIAAVCSKYVGGKGVVIVLVVGGRVYGGVGATGVGSSMASSMASTPRRGVVGAEEADIGAGERAKKRGSLLKWTKGSRLFSLFA